MGGRLPATGGFHGVTASRPTSRCRSPRRRSRGNRARRPPHPSAPLERHGKTVTRAKGDPALRFNPVSRRHT